MNVCLESADKEFGVFYKIVKDIMSDILTTHF